MNNKINKIFSLIERMEHRPLGSLLNESQESTSQKEAIRYIEQKKGWSHEEADNFVRVTLRNDITSLRDRKIAKFTLGVTRMLFDGEINNERIISDLNETLKLLSAHLNEYDRNLNGLSAQELINRFKQVRLDNYNAERAEIDSMNFSGGSNYTIVPINSFEEAKKYYEYTNPDSRWCLTYMENMFDTYTRDGVNQIYFCLQNGFENVPRQVGDKAPLDEYGLSMLSIIVDENGELAYCTTRWNHKNGGSDNAMSAKEVSQVVGVNFYNTFKPNNKWANIIETVKQRLANGESPEDVFDYIGDFYEGFACVQLNGKWNLINQEAQLISNQWFDSVFDFNNGFAVIELNGKYNFIDQEAQLISNQWYDNVRDFSYGFAMVELNGKSNFIDQEAHLISNQWFDDVSNFYKGFARVKLKGESYYIDTSGKLHNNINENKEYKISKNMSKNKNMKNKLIRLTEGDLHRIIKESVNKMLKEASYDANGNFNAESHNLDLKNRFKSIIISLLENMNNTVILLSHIEGSATDENLKNMARIVINDLLKSDESVQEVYRMVKADRWDLNEN